ncbi:homeobox-leucine zipper protein PROTODERMAL FACTOR 2-like [Herrania umbratica]|uniref:Homeobox-leucine zipper protein PROTODERMAL FACTOR 2-like n=1 Tax=Herrania umbratica TaxID=108875 RepID=A0A6J1AJL1_9ROSI|nr:homeobox-leucine zipper protein PROTODERMAL FACTOR 2-like [Herrania umbratica]
MGVIVSKRINLEEQLYFDYSESRVGLRDDSIGDMPPVRRDGIGVGKQPLGLDPPRRNPQRGHRRRRDHEGVGSLSVTNPQPPQNNSLGPQSPGSRPSGSESPGSGSSTNVPMYKMHRASDILMAFSICPDTKRNEIIEQAKEALEELKKMASMGEPLWQRKDNMEILDGIQYLKLLRRYDLTADMIIKLVERGGPQRSPSPGGNQDMPTFPLAEFQFNPLYIEGSRETGLVDMKPVSIVELLMDSRQWLAAFPSIVSRATLIGVILHGANGSYDGRVQVIAAEFHHSSPLIPSRQSYFARYSKQIARGTWGVVDVSLENLFPSTHVQFRRSPSGCIIEEMPNESSRVTWVEHAQVDNGSVHPIFRPFVESGSAFSAKRWIAMINRHCQWLATSMARTSPTNASVFIPQVGRESLLKLSERMTRTFFNNVSSCSENFWLRAPGAMTHDQDIRYRLGKIVNAPEKPPTGTIIFTTTLRLPVPPKILFDFLRDERTRDQWDHISFGRSVRELIYVQNGENRENRVSVVKVNSSPSKIHMLLLQESFSDETGSYVVYAPMDIFGMSMILNGGNPNFAAILASGFTILPDLPPPWQAQETEGSILNLVFHRGDRSFIDDNIPVNAFGVMDDIVSKTINAIKKALMPDGSGNQSARK